MYLFHGLRADPLDKSMECGLVIRFHRTSEYSVEFRGSVKGTQRFSYIRSAKKLMPDEKAQLKAMIQWRAASMGFFCIDERIDRFEKGRDGLEESSHSGKG